MGRKKTCVTGKKNLLTFIREHESLNLPNVFINTAHSSDKTWEKNGEGCTCWGPAGPSGRGGLVIGSVFAAMLNTLSGPSGIPGRGGWMEDEEQC